MAVHGVPGVPPEGFQRAVEALRSARLRPEVRLEEVPAPGRIAPYSAALSADVVAGPAEDVDELATGRFVLLHDPAGQEAWEGTFRVVSFVRAELEPEMGADPLLGQVGWSWLVECLTNAGASAHAAGGTVTRVLSDSHGSLAERPATVEIEVRASWTPEGADLAPHLHAWADLLCTVAGLPPLPEGVAPLTRRLR
ncbi:DUF3000 domain-containing protein [Thalassiella azotivora]